MPIRNDDASPGGMGLGSGVLARIANLSAILLICIMFYQDRHAALESSREDRALFRQAIDRIEQLGAKQNQEHQREMSEQARAIRDLAEQVKRLADKQ